MYFIIPDTLSASSAVHKMSSPLATFAANSMVLVPLLQRLPEGILANYPAPLLLNSEVSRLPSKNFLKFLSWYP